MIDSWDNVVGSAETEGVKVQDLVDQFPGSTTLEYRKGRSIYGPDEPSVNIYMVAAGKVKLSLIAESGREILLEIIRSHELFGESALLKGAGRSEQATALETSELVMWPVSAVEDLVTKQPMLAVVLLRIFAHRAADFAHRLESFSFDNIEQRLARSLIRFSERLGTLEKDGSARMMPLTHELLSRHVGTSRELVTLYMNQFKKQGYLRYSRQGIVLYPEALAAYLAGTSRSAAAGPS
jgi:CRP/FNR family transcriptional regulator, cyclic AMP receptor protein